MIECDCSPIVPNSHHRTCPTYQAIEASIRELENSDHAFLPEEAVRSICEPFGFMPSCYTTKATPNEFKGLSLWDENGNPIDELRGQAADIVAKQICNHLKIDYPRFYGRGSQLWGCIKALKEFWQVEEKEVPRRTS